MRQPAHELFFRNPHNQDLMWIIEGNRELPSRIAQREVTLAGVTLPFKFEMVAGG